MTKTPNNEDNIRKAKELIERAKSVAVLTGAGISAESGVPTFRDPDGLWAKFKPEELANFDAFLNNPKLIWEWYEHRRDIIRNVHPNPGHHALVKLENSKDNFTLITQNVDGLHRRAGSENVIEVHGNIMRSYCVDCEKDKGDVKLSKDMPFPICDHCGGKVRPGVVWFGEMLPMNELIVAEQAARTCDLFLSIGTSAVVYPAAGLPLIAKESGATVIEINPVETEISRVLDLCLFGKSGAILPLLF